MTFIPKLAAADRYRRPLIPFGNARSAFRAFLSGLSFGPGEHVLLPAFIGWSAREGSGVFDPIRDLGLPAEFFAVDDALRIDLEDLREVLRQGRTRVLVLIHYFGYVDPNYEAAVQLGREYGATVLEDEAHALLTDFIGGAAGRLGDAAILSLHKMLPVPDGGMLVLNDPDRFPAQVAVVPAGAERNPWDFDLHAIARCRVENADCLTELLKPFAGAIDPLWPEPRPGVVPQTFPVLIRAVSRDDLYFRMNAKGFGVVSLYHTLIDEIAVDRFPASHQLAQTIMNLPVHQDATADALHAMVNSLADAVVSPSGGRR